MILPGIGRRTAEKFAYAVLQSTQNSAHELSEAIADLQAQIKTCIECRRYSATDICDICSDQKRNNEILCVIADQRTLPLFENSGYNGKYFVLGAVLNPVDGITADVLPIKELNKVVENRGVKEVILAFNLDQPGEATTLYLKDVLSSAGVLITRPARGLTTGAQLEYADEYTLSDAISNRRSI
jgi:recombination protein RecR